MGERKEIGERESYVHMRMYAGRIRRGHGERVRRGAGEDKGRLKEGRVLSRQARGRWVGREGSSNAHTRRYGEAREG